MRDDICKGWLCFAIFTALILLVVLIGLVNVARAADQAYIIEDDGGGIVESYEEHYRELKMSGIPIQVAGDCVSACTYVLGMPSGQVCAWPGARLGFHFVEDDDKIDYSDTRRVVEEHYPVAVAKWFLEQKPRVTDKEKNAIYWRQATDFFPPCAGEEPEYLKNRSHPDD